MAKHKGGHHGGSWKVAYADFVTAMMALFMVLWLTAQDTKIKEAVERAFRNPFSAISKESVGIIPNKETTSTHKAEGAFESISAIEVETMRRISEDLARILQQQDESEKSVELQVTSDGLRINVFDRSRKPIFEAETDVFTTYGGWVFSTLAWEISRYRSFKIELEGHTESKTPPPEQTAEKRGKWELSTDRANAARRMLASHGVDPRQLWRVSGFADTVPMPELPPHDEANRRVTVLLRLRETLAEVSASTQNPAGNTSYAN